VHHLNCPVLTLLTSVVFINAVSSTFILTLYAEHRPVRKLGAPAQHMIFG